MLTFLGLITPAKVTLSKLTAGSKSLTATWKTVSGKKIYGAWSSVKNIKVR